VPGPPPKPAAPKSATPKPGAPKPATPKPATPPTTPKPATPKPTPAPPAAHRPSPQDLAYLPGRFAVTSPVHDPEPTYPHETDGFDTGERDDAGERGLRGLVGGGSSQLTVTAAMRARDAARPTDEDLATAEAELPIVRRGWIPRDELPRLGRRP